MWGTASGNWFHSPLIERQPRRFASPERLAPPRSNQPYRPSM